MIPGRRPVEAVRAAARRRALDVILASIGLILAAPLMALASLAILMETPGPVVFRQTRIGIGGRRFCLYKFRKFRTSSEGNGRAVTLKGDPRMTRVGRLLERSKLDELPQLWNVLIGDMSIVGPRPETLDFADCFAAELEAVLDHKPGLFGPSQALFRNEGHLYPADRDPHEFYRAVLFPSKARIDLSYFPQRTLFSDLRWVALCGLAVLGARIGRGGGAPIVGGEPPRDECPVAARAAATAEGK